MLLASIFISVGLCLMMTALIWGGMKSSKDKRTIKHLPFSIIPLLRYPLVALMFLAGFFLVSLGFWLLDN